MLSAVLTLLGAVQAPLADPPCNTLPDTAQTLLNAHNSARSAVGAEPLRWSDQLAQEAGRWACHLAREGRLVHADRSSRNGSGENLWMGTAARFAPQRMVGRFVEERRYYSAGTFPDVSTTGRWQDVGHYTQIVWRNTRDVGCAIARGEGRDVLVCRYWPAGNVIGQRPY